MIEYPYRVHFVLPDELHVEGKEKEKDKLKGEEKEREEEEEGEEEQKGEEVKVERDDTND